MKSQPLDPKFQDLIFSKEIKEEKGNSFFTSHLREHEEKRGEEKIHEGGEIAARRSRLEFLEEGGHTTTHKLRRRAVITCTEIEARRHEF